MNRIGIMQGRLSLPVHGQIQAFPLNWQAEFARAHSAGIDCLEWLYREPADGSPNPLDDPDGLRAIRDCERTSGVRVRSICGDYFVDHPLIVAGEIVWPAATRLLELLHRAATLTVVYVVVPFVGRVPGADTGVHDLAWLEGSRLRTAGDQQALVQLLLWLQSTLTKLDLRLCLESDWPARRLRAVFRLLGDDPRLTVCYDMGDRAALGFLPTGDLALLGDRIGAVHVKDRAAGSGGATVRLGQGVVDFPAVARGLARGDYRGSLILQTARGRVGEETAQAVANRVWLTQVWQQALEEG